MIGALAHVLVCAGCAADLGPKERFAKAATIAKANLETPAGRSYEEALAVHFQKHNTEALMQCVNVTAEPDSSPFEMIFELSSTGTARSILVWPETNLARCFKVRLGEEPFPIPPTDGYLALMEMSFSP
jgi:hypothetical protein